MAELTLHLAKMPRRPASEDTFTRSLLSAINPNNCYARNSDLPLPHLELGALPKDNRRISYREIGMPEAPQVYSTAKTEVLRRTLNDSSNVKHVFEALFKQLDAVYNADSAPQFTIGNLRKMCRQIERSPTLNLNLTLLELQVVKRRLRHLEPKICTKSQTHLFLLDQRFKIVCLSKATCDHYNSMAFLTFSDHEAAKKFASSFDGKLIMGGRKIKISFATQDSLVGGYLLSGKRGVDRLLSRKAHKEPTLGLKTGTDKNQSKRQMRRLRHKLALKGLDASVIQEMVHKAVQDRISSSAANTPQSELKTKSPEPRDNKKKRAVAEVAINPPNKVLLVQNLPPGAQTDDISSIFAADGFIEVRLVGVRNLAFVEYASASHASNVVSKLGSSYKWDGSTISIGFAK
ncbi:Mud1p LALA0_S03e05908g [Lachancea lanzarotensis]|uniref:LALA0S03e05908g1_1 n=1 Tax=Lachancea lanzarotensis TaxID=1245769 RepID=A0A0C7N0W9_9SACH|nr:uncharacterized protein LALA0_S03e05908g [Lachancea lanzarotensis]CEP61574.1 LALA0S03e05908g1_1 [Lachancea lanzarotensis]